MSAQPGLFGALASVAELMVPQSTGTKSVRFFIAGEPRPGGSKRAIHHKATGRIIVMDASGKKGRTWRADIKDAAEAARVGVDEQVAFFEGPVRLTCLFYQNRPKWHYGRRNGQPYLKENSPRYPTGAPDTTKLLRALEDALKGILWKDDAQVVIQHAYKKYCSEVENRPGADVMIESLE